jgi:hypothetical protein
MLDADSTRLLNPAVAAARGRRARLGLDRRADAGGRARGARAAAAAEPRAPDVVDARRPVLAFGAGEPHATDAAANWKVCGASLRAATSASPRPGSPATGTPTRSPTLLRCWWPTAT